MKTDNLNCHKNPKLSVLRIFNAFKIVASEFGRRTRWVMIHAELSFITTVWKREILKNTVASDITCDLAHLRSRYQSHISWKNVNK